MSYFPTITAAQISDATAAGRNVIKTATPAGGVFLRVNSDNTVSQLDAAGLASDLTGGGGNYTGTASPVNSLSAVNGVITSAS